MTNPVITISTMDRTYHLVEGENSDGVYNTGDHVYLDSDGDRVFNSKYDEVLSDHYQIMLDDLGISFSGLSGKNIRQLADYSELVQDIRFGQTQKNPKNVSKWLYLDMTGLWYAAKEAGVVYADVQQIYSIDYFDAVKESLPPEPESNIKMFVFTWNMDPQDLPLPEPKLRISQVHEEAYFATLTIMQDCIDQLDMQGAEEAAVQIRRLSKEIPQAEQMLDVIWSSERQKERYALAAIKEMTLAKEKAELGLNEPDSGFEYHIKRAFQYGQKAGNLDDVAVVYGQIDFSKAYKKYFELIKMRAVDEARYGLFDDMKYDLELMESVGYRVLDLSNPIASEREISLAKKEVFRVLSGEL